VIPRPNGRGRRVANDHARLDAQVAPCRHPGCAAGRRQPVGDRGPGGRLPGSQLEGLLELLNEATPLEARYLLRTVTANLRLGIGTPTILDALAEVHAGSRKQRPVLERAYNICSDLSLVAATLVTQGMAAVEAM